MTAYGTVKLGPNDYMWSCSICSALVVNRSSHDQWHLDQDEPPSRLRRLFGSGRDQ